VGTDGGEHWTLLYSQ